MKKVLVFPGDDASPEAVLPSLELIKALNLPIGFEIPELDLAKLSQGILPKPLKEQIDSSDAVLFGAASGPTMPILLYLRWGLDNYANLRPVRYIPRTQSVLKNPEVVDYVIVRENLEELYPGREGDLEDLINALPDVTDVTGRKVRDLKPPGKFALRVITENYTRKIAEFAVVTARTRQSKGYPGRVACFTKLNMMKISDGFFNEICESVIRGAGLEYEHYIVDDAARRLVQSPEQFDVIVMPNFYGDVLSDVGAGTVGGLGLAPSGCYGGATPYFEPVHGTAPDIAGKNIINPTATLLSACMMLEHLGFTAESRALEVAIHKTYSAGAVLPVDQGGRASTGDFCKAVLSSISV